MPSIAFGQRIRRMMRRRSRIPPPQSPTGSVVSNHSDDHQESSEGSDEELDTSCNIQCLDIHMESKEMTPKKTQVNGRTAWRRESAPAPIVQPYFEVGTIKGLEELDLPRFKAVRKMGLSMRKVTSVTPVIVTSNEEHDPKSTKPSPQIEKSEGNIYIQDPNCSYSRMPSVDSEPDYALFSKNSLPVPSQMTPMTSHENPVNNKRPTVLWKEELTISKKVKRSPIMVQLTKFTRRSSPNFLSSNMVLRY